MLLDQHTLNQNQQTFCSPSPERRAVVNAHINKDTENAEEAFTDNAVEASKEYTKGVSTENANEMSGVLHCTP